uniref:PPM-type phosphatase domain-containing protein n=1 Tax=Salix viminalis TaxID=40686 RepID=A0A6N2MQ28_SALVM
MRLPPHADGARWVYGGRCCLSPEHIIVANCGDSRAALSRGGRAFLLVLITSRIGRMNLQESKLLEAE